MAMMSSGHDSNNELQARWNCTPNLALNIYDMQFNMEGVRWFTRKVHGIDIRSLVCWESPSQVPHRFKLLNLDVGHRLTDTGEIPTCVPPPFQQIQDDCHWHTHLNHERFYLSANVTVAKCQIQMACGLKRPSIVKNNLKITTSHQYCAVNLWRWFTSLHAIQQTLDSECVCVVNLVWNGTLRGFSRLLLSTINVVNPHKVKRASVSVCWVLRIRQNLPMGKCEDVLKSKQDP